MTKITLKLDVHHGHEHPTDTGLYECVYIYPSTRITTLRVLHFDAEHDRWTDGMLDKVTYPDSTIVAWWKTPVSDMIEKLMPRVLVCNDCGKVFSEDELVTLEEECHGTEGPNDIYWTESYEGCPYCGCGEYTEQEVGE